MAQLQHVAHYISDSENDIDMEIQPSSNTETVKRKKKKRQTIESKKSFIDTMISYIYFIFLFVSCQL